MNPDIKVYENEIIKLNYITSNTTLLGHIYGRIKSSQENVFFINTGVESSASKAIYEVYLIHDATTHVEPLTAVKYFEMKLYPNPTKDKMRIEFSLRIREKQAIHLYGINGQLIKTLSNKIADSGLYYYDIDTSDLSPAVYFININTEDFSHSKRFIKE